MTTAMDDAIEAFRRETQLERAKMRQEAEQSQTQQRSEFARLKKKIDGAAAGVVHAALMMAKLQVSAAQASAAPEMKKMADDASNFTHDTNVVGLVIEAFEEEVLELEDLAYFIFMITCYIRTSNMRMMPLLNLLKKEYCKKEDGTVVTWAMHHFSTKQWLTDALVTELVLHPDRDAVEWNLGTGLNLLGILRTVKDTTGKTPLAVATDDGESIFSILCKYRHTTAARLIVNDIPNEMFQVPDQYGDTPLIAAVSNAHMPNDLYKVLEMISILDSDVAADHEITDISGFSAAMILVLDYNLTGFLIAVMNHFFSCHSAMWGKENNHFTKQHQEEILTDEGLLLVDVLKQTEEKASETIMRGDEAYTGFNQCYHPKIMTQIIEVFKDKELLCDTERLFHRLCELFLAMLSHCDKDERPKLRKVYAGWVHRYYRRQP